MTFAAYVLLAMVALLVAFTVIVLVGATGWAALGLGAIAGAGASVAWSGWRTPET